MTAIFCDWNMPAEHQRTVRTDAPVMAEWSGPKPLPPMGPRLDWTVASTRQQVQDHDC